jgi:hypothetical protein
VCVKVGSGSLRKFGVYTDDHKLSGACKEEQIYNNECLRE